MLMPALTGLTLLPFAFLGAKVISNEPFGPLGPYRMETTPTLTPMPGWVGEGQGERSSGHRRHLASIGAAPRARARLRELARFARTTAHSRSRTTALTPPAKAPRKEMSSPNASAADIDTKRYDRQIRLWCAPMPAHNSPP